MKWEDSFEIPLPTHNIAQKSFQTSRENFPSSLYLTEVSVRPQLHSWCEQLPAWKAACGEGGQTWWKEGSC